MRKKANKPKKTVTFEDPAKIKVRTGCAARKKDAPSWHDKSKDGILRGPTRVSPFLPLKGFTLFLARLDPDSWVCVFFSLRPSSSPFERAATSGEARAPRKQQPVREVPLAPMGERVRPGRCSRRENTQAAKVGEDTSLVPSHSLCPHSLCPHSESSFGTVFLTHTPLLHSFFLPSFLWFHPHTGPATLRRITAWTWRGSTTTGVATPRLQGATSLRWSTLLATAGYTRPSRLPSRS